MSCGRSICSRTRSIGDRCRVYSIQSERGRWKKWLADDAICRSRHTSVPLDKPFPKIPSLLFSMLTQRSELLKSVHKPQRTPAAQQVSTPDAIVGHRQLARQPMKIVVVYVESLFGIGAPAAAKGSMKNLAILWRLCGVPGADQ